MAVTFPRALPTGAHIRQTNFDLKWLVSTGRTRGGGVQVTEWGDAYWQATLGFSALRPGDFITYRTWIDSLRGGQKTFLAHDQARPRPLNYTTDTAVTSLTRAGGGSFDGRASTTVMPTGGKSLSFGVTGSLRLPAGFVVKAGDYLSALHVGSTNVYSLHRVTEDITADGSGVLNAVQIEPAIDKSIFAVADVANFLYPVAEFVIDPGTIQGEPDIAGSGLSFTASSRTN